MLEERGEVLYCGSESAVRRRLCQIAEVSAQDGRAVAHQCDGGFQLAAETDAHLAIANRQANGEGHVAARAAKRDESRPLIVAGAVDKD